MRRCRNKALLAAVVSMCTIILLERQVYVYVGFDAISKEDLKISARNPLESRQALHKLSNTDNNRPNLNINLPKQYTKNIEMPDANLLKQRTHLQNPDVNLGTRIKLPRPQNLDAKISMLDINEHNVNISKQHPKATAGMGTRELGPEAILPTKKAYSSKNQALPMYNQTTPKDSQPKPKDSQTKLEDSQHKPTNNQTKTKDSQSKHKDKHNLKDNQTMPNDDQTMPKDDRNKREDDLTKSKYDQTKAKDSFTTSGNKQTNYLHIVNRDKAQIELANQTKLITQTNAPKKTISRLALRPKITIAAVESVLSNTQEQKTTINQSKVHSNNSTSEPSEANMPDTSRPDGRCDGCFSYRAGFFITPPQHFCSPRAKDSKGSLDLLVMVTSVHETRRRRDIIRRTWGSYSTTTDRVRVLFLFGLHDKHDVNLQEQLQLESEEFGDILQVVHPGLYRHLPYLVFNAYHWVQTNCPQARYIAKPSEDTYLNIPGILQLLERHGQKVLNNVVFGDCIESGGARVEREFNGTLASWAQTFESYPYERYPSYCSGAGTFMSATLMHKLLPHVSNIRFPIAHDDVMLGMLLRLTNHCQCNITGFMFFNYSKGYELSEEIPSKTDIGCGGLDSGKPLLGIHMHRVDPEIIERLWDRRTCFEYRVPTPEQVMCPNSEQCREDLYHLH